MATGPVKVKIEVKPEAVDVSEYVELYFAMCGHQRVNVTPEEARELCRLLFHRGYGPKDHALVTLQRYEHLLMAECGHRGHCDHKADKAKAAEHGMRESLRDELIPFLQDYVDEELAKQNAATVAHVDMKVTERVDAHTHAMEQRLYGQLHDYTDQRMRVLGKELREGTTTAAAASSLTLADIEKAARLVDDRFISSLLKAEPITGLHEAPVSTKQAAAPKSWLSPRLHLDLRQNDWKDRHGRSWVCASVMQEFCGSRLAGVAELQLRSSNYVKPGTAQVDVRALSRTGSSAPRARVNNVEREVYPELYNWLQKDGAPDPAYISMEVAQYYHQQQQKKERRLVSGSPVLSKHSLVPDWVDGDGTLWACDSVLRKKFPQALDGAKRIKLVAYNMEGPGTVKVRRHQYNSNLVLVEEFNSQLGTTVMKEHDAHPALLEWLGNMGTLVYVGVGTLERHNQNKRGTNDCKAATPVLHLDKGLHTPCWNGKDGEPWVCGDAIHGLAPWVKDGDTMQLLAFATPSGPGMQRTVRLQLYDRCARWPLLVDGVETDSLEALRTWLKQDGMPSPAYVTAHVVGKARPEKPLSTTELLCIDSDGDWMDRHDASWVCGSAVRRFAPHVKLQDEIRLLAFEQDAPGRVKVEVVRALIDKEQLRVNGNEMGVFTSLMNWVIRLAWNRPVYVEARVA